MYESKIISSILLGLFRFSFILLPITKSYIDKENNENGNNNEVTVYDELKKRQKERKNFEHNVRFYAFGAGIMLYTSMVYLTVQVHNTFHQAHPKSVEYSCLRGQFAISVGFFSMYFVEEICHWLMIKMMPSKKSNGGLGFKLTDAGIGLRAIFEGLAIGLQDENEDVWFLTLSISIHSATTMMCVGSNTSKSAKKRTIICHFLLQALTVPAGIVIGCFICCEKYYIDTDDLAARGHLEALSTGSLLYITFFEALYNEKKRRVLRYKRSVSMVLGFVLMGNIKFLLFHVK